MRKYLFLMVALVGVLSFTGCSKDDDGYYNPNRTFIYNITANDNNWRYSTDGLTLYYDIDLPELSDYYITDGFVSAAISVDGEGSYNILPATYDGVAYSVNYAVGSVILKVEDPLIDPNIGLQPPSDNMVLKIVLSDSDFVP